MLIPFLPRSAFKFSPSAAVPSYLTTLNRLCQELFSGTFSASIRFSLFVPLPTCAACIFYQVPSRLSSAFFFLFSKDFLALPFGLFPSRTSPPVPGQLVYYISPPPLCQYPFSLFYVFFLKNLQKSSHANENPLRSIGGGEISLLPIRLFLSARSFRFLTALDAGAFIVFSLTELGKHARLGARTLKASQRAVQRFIIFHADL